MKCSDKKWRPVAFISKSLSDTERNYEILSSTGRSRERWGGAGSGERGKKDVYCDKQLGKAVTALNCMLKGSWGEVGSGGIRKKLKSEYAAYLESKYRRNDGSSI